MATKFVSDGARALNRDQYLERIQGMVFGDRVEDGIVRGNEFLHPLLRIGVKFPEGWELTNTPSAVLAQEPGTDHYMVLQEVEQPAAGQGYRSQAGRSIGDAAVAAMRQAGYTVVDGRVDRINGNEAHVGLYRGNAKDVGKVLMRAAHIAIGRQLYVVAGFAPEQEFAQVDNDILPSVQTFRQLSTSEAAAVRPNRVDFYVVKSGDSWQSIAARQGKNFVNAATLAIMNDHDVHVQPTAGNRVKIVVEG
jgi:predicted Zn-dependent protease